jgi:hypothetical protein
MQDFKKCPERNDLNAGPFVFGFWTCLKITKTNAKTEKTAVDSQ